MAFVHKWEKTGGYNVKMARNKEMKKINPAHDLFAKYNGLFRCPVCGKDLAVNRTNSLVCQRGHNYDLAKQGYVNLLLKQGKSDYDKKLFTARRVISASGFFDPMLNTVSKLIRKETAKEGLDVIRILDVGCGEGSHLAKIIANPENKKKPTLLGVGVDLSKEGIRGAAKEHQEIVWCVADLAKLPLQKEQFDVLLNILAPANYGEFKRVLKEHGLLFKVVPASNYLIELREILFKGTDREFYKNDSVKQHFANSFQLLKEEQIRYQVMLKGDNLEHLIKMTPLTWNAAQEQVDEIIKTGLESITVAFDVLVGEK
jgi:23S rRNA (guanine745-N1)-methyltransferase